MPLLFGIGNEQAQFKNLYSITSLIDLNVQADMLHVMDVYNHSNNEER